MAKDEFTFSSCIGSNDDLVCLGKAKTNNLELLEG
ncbi:hypothetical protein IX299_001978 [Porphyromonas levii]|nr:hypothetical protein [Porphyromonas levii]